MTKANKTQSPLELRGQVGADFDQIDVAFGIGEREQPVQIILASEGGSSSIGLLIAQQVKDCRIRAEFAESAGVNILVAGADRELAADGWLFVHRSWSVETGNATHMRKCADYLDQLDLHNAETIAPRTKLSTDQVLDLIQREVTISPEMALEYGFIDRIGEPAGLAHKKQHNPESMREAQALSMIGMQLAIAKPGAKLNGLSNHAAHVAGESDERYRAIDETHSKRRTVAVGAGIKRANSIWNGAFTAVWRRLQKTKAGQSPGEQWAGRWQCSDCNATNFKPAEVEGEPTPCFSCGSME